MNLNARSKLLIQNGDGNNLITTVTSTVYSYKCGNTHNAKVAFTSGFILLPKLIFFSVLIYLFCPVELNAHTSHHKSFQKQ